MSEATVMINEEGPEQAAEVLFRSKNPSKEAIREPCGIAEIRAAVDRLGRLFDDLPGSVVVALEAGRNAGDLLSSDRLQGIAEVIQNADDVEATEVRITSRPGELLVGHNGNPLRLVNVLALAMPWLTTKAGEEASIGRFGIGLMTMRALSPILDVHCHEYHVRIGSPTISSIETLELPESLFGEGWTVFRIPTETQRVSTKNLEDWLRRWDDSALLFLRTVSRVVLLSNAGEPVHTLSLKRSAADRIRSKLGRAVRSAKLAEADDGRAWVILTANPDTPKGVTRARKNVGAKTPIGVALPIHDEEGGVLYAGLPLLKLGVPARLNAQFDPLASRQGIQSNEWNTALFPLVADLWVRAILFLFEADPKRVWRLLPIFSDDRDESAAPASALETLIVERARTRLVEQIRIDVPGNGRLPLSGLAVEVPQLESVLSSAEIAELADLRATLPPSARDVGGIWRRVLQDWREAGATLPLPVGVKQAISLLTRSSFSPERTLAVAASAIMEGTQAELKSIAWIPLRSGDRCRLPERNAANPLVLGDLPLASTLTFGQRVDDVFKADSPEILVVLEWLRNESSLLTSSDERSILQHLARAGNQGQRLSAPLMDHQVVVLRDAFESLSQVDRSALGLGIGLLIKLEGFMWQSDGNRIDVSVSPGEAYLPRAIDREESAFALACSSARNIPWLHSKYADLLRSPAGRTGLGAQRFLRYLGTDTAPRLQRHRGLVKRYSDYRYGLHRDAAGSPPERRQALMELEATYTLEDYESPVLQSGVLDIARASDGEQRRRRASAMIETLGRAWERLSDSTEVSAALDSWGWQTKGEIRAFWLWAAGSVAWLDDAAGVPRRPVELRLQTPGTLAMYGRGAPNFLHRSFDAARRDVLQALGVQGEPSMAELLVRLAKLRDDPDPVWSDLDTDTAIIYQAIAVRLNSPGFRDVSIGRLRQRFTQGQGLVFTQGAWRKPDGLLSGPRIFGDFRAFVPQVPFTEPLWRALRVPAPSQSDCVEVLRTLAHEHRPTESNLNVMLESLRLLQSQIVQTRLAPSTGKMLGSLPLWTSLGWRRVRPVYAVGDPVLAERLGEHLPVWQPGGDVEQFQPILRQLRISLLSAEDAHIQASAQAEKDEELTEKCQSALSLLREDLARNDPEASRSLQIPWEDLLGTEIRVHPGLEIGLNIPGYRDLTVPVLARLDRTGRTLYIDHPDSAPKPIGGGRAIAGLFDSNQRSIALAWRDAWERAEEGIAARQVLLAEQKAKTEQDKAQRAIEERLREFQSKTEAARLGRNRSPSRSKDAGSVTSAQESSPPDPTPKQRSLVDPARLELTDPSGKILGGNFAKRQNRSKARTLANPRRNGLSPQSRTPAPSYTPTSRESVGLELLRTVLGSDADEISDLRAQHGVGADAIDALDRFFELKVYAGAEPDRVRLEEAEVRRALDSSDFFLVVVSNVEESAAKPSVRIVVDPLRQLTLESGSLSLVGIRDSRSLVYQFREPATADDA